MFHDFFQRPIVADKFVQTLYNIVGKFLYKEWIGVGDTGEDNFTFNVTKECDVTVTYNPTTNESLQQVKVL